MHISQDLESATIKSGSRLRVWWLRTLCGYDIVLTKSTPSLDPFGRMYTRRVWHLRKRKEKS